jgi:hypothetical protein
MVQKDENIRVVAVHRRHTSRRTNFEALLASLGQPDLRGFWIGLELKELKSVYSCRPP